MADQAIPADLDEQGEALPVTRESSRGGNEPPPHINDRPDQNVAYDEVVKGRPLTADERTRAEQESPVSGTRQSPTVNARPR